MKRLSIQLSAALALVGGSGLSSCGMIRSYDVYSGQMSPVREDAVSVEVEEGLPQLDASESLASEMMKESASVSTSQNQPELPNVPESVQNRDASDTATKSATSGVSQNQPEVASPRPDTAPAAAGASQNQPELAQPKPEPKTKPAVSTKQNQPELAKPKPEPKKTKPTVSTKQNQPEVAKPKPEPKKTKPTVSTKQNQPEVAKPKPEPKKTKPETKKEKPAPAKAKPTKTTQLTVVTLKKGDTLQDIARKHGVTLNALYKENGINAGTRLRSGMQIRIPKRSFWRRILRLPWSSPRTESTAPSKAAPTKTAKPSTRKSAPRKRKMSSYTVKPGDTISEIAKKYDVSSSAIMQANDLNSREVRRLREGQKLRIPVSR